MNSKILVLSIGVIAIGLFALPSTMSLFSGQHTFYSGENVTCSKCHQDISDEVASANNQVHTSTGFKACEGCHATGTSSGANVTNNSWKLTSTYAGVTGTVVFKAHAAVTVECLACHGRNNTDYNKEWGVAVQIQSPTEAHRTFYWGSVSDKEVGQISQTTVGQAISGTAYIWNNGSYNQTAIKLKGSNAACVGCHTHTYVNITWRRSDGYSVTANTTSGDFVLSNWAASSNIVENTTSGQ